MLDALLALSLALQSESVLDPVDAHSEHGAAFDTGPRQAAVLMPGPDRIDFPVSIAPDREHLAAFVEQGIAQLHGFWYLEAERTFRQILSEDPDCAMAQWGLAMANVDHPERAAWFARAAWLKRGLVTKRERMYIDMIARFYSVDGPDEPEGLVEARNPAPGEERDADALPSREAPSKAACERLVRDYEALVWEHPDDIEAKAFLVNRIWLNRRARGIKTTSRMAVEALLDQIFAVEPMHPAHHYRIHLWDRSDEVKHIVDTAAACGPAMPNIAHNWHMGGHVFAHLGRHFDASWQQEASARVDHAHMARFWILPDEIHNFAHNNEWLTRSLRHQGRVDEAVELAKNMVELPRHPRFNTVDKPRTSSAYGRRRLIETLSAFEQWETLKELGSSMYLEPHVEDAGGAVRAYAMGRAAAHLGDPEGLAAATVELESMIADLKSERAAAVDEAEAEALAAEKKAEDVRKAMDEALRSFEGRLRTLRDNVDALRALADLAAGGDRGAALAALEDARYDRIHLARMLVESEEPELRKKAVETARDAARNRKGQLVEHATLAYVLWKAGERDEAIEVFEELREGAALADLDLPPLRRLAPLVTELGLGADWRPDFAAASDVAARPDLAGLGPAHWIPPMAPDFTLPDAYGDEVTLSDLRGRPVLVVNFLGFGCVHCVEQLQALVPVADRFREAGIEILAVGLNPVEDLRESLGDDPDDTGFPFRVLADPSLAQFKEWRAFDDFEGIALHGTYLVDGNGRVRWIDISHLPFMDVEFLLDEAKRLLALPVRGDAPLAAATPVLRPNALRGAEVAPADEVEPSNALRVGLLLDAAPHCQNCIKDLNRILGDLEGFVSLDATPNEARIAVTVDGTRVGSKAVLEALAAGGRPGRLDPE